MIIRQPQSADWEKFSALAVTENWRVPEYELRLFQGPWSQSAYVLDEDGFCGLVTAVAYETIAWIGNLIVPQNLRGKGYGSHLFKSVLANLVDQGMASVWLTASDQGRSIYEKEGFVEVDQVERWVLPPGEGIDFPAGGEGSFEKLLSADRLVWNERRDPLLSVLCDGGKVFVQEDAVALLQTESDVQIIGPWYSQNPSLHDPRKLLEMIIAATNRDLPVVVDTMVSSFLPAICATAGFQCSGRTSLMAYGDVGPINLPRMLSLASLGSVG